MIEIVYHGEAAAAFGPDGQAGGFENADGNGEIHLYPLLDGVSAMCLRLEMGSYTEIRTQIGMLEINFCANGRFETRFSLRDHVLLKPGDMSMVVKLLFFSCCGWIGELMITLYTVLV